MADPTDADEVDEEAAPKKNWRKELEDRAAQAETAQAEMAQELAFYRAGLEGLTDDQRDDVLTLAKAKGQTGSAEALKAIADRLSYTKPATGTEPEQAQEDAEKAAELAQLANLAKSPASPAEPARGQAAVAKEIEDFDGDWQAFQQFVLTRADDILP